MGGVASGGSSLGTGGFREGARSVESTAREKFRVRL